ncbi:hypothetical protein [Streptomyces sp. NPDC053367]|uniref:hypothetical protein n=1 Tax=Streptomyces sp. NPDC053367 TaxID=3365700 RepID=UPI0037D00592
MTITMQNYALTWTDSNGTKRASAVAYDEPSAERRRLELATAGASGIAVVPVAVGQLPAISK